ncbi:hypothetical protein ABB37_08294 [Leptomonas pyrrhocoris]|uniref:Uncharacterized protein n=1 Tax=Leptomonas pyrrhocoris TaxID=157538 RepID=A0A0M9FTR0_LEPPY|nr:hypothetical protein ABB37_08294 [Leptomonas pyrrhocoris]KPA75759.1 hypothetical protein ABB37_08294 [Leptomonas pyrrhocoris]|eukprot:XP_015654198.1 hypothetical protein ABB37_08294 [Leptomonas pyrrhocoris]
MCRGGGGGYFKADAATGRTYRVNWVRPRDFSRPPTISSSGAATPASSSPLQVNVLASELDAATGAVVHVIQAVDYLDQPPLSRQALQPPPPIEHAHRHLQFDVPLLDTAVSTPKNVARAKLTGTATPSAETSSVAVRDTVAAVGITEEGKMASAGGGRGTPNRRAAGAFHDPQRSAGPTRRTPLAAAPSFPLDTPAPRSSTDCENPAIALDADHGATSASCVFQWLGSSNRVGEASRSDEAAAAPFCVPPEAMLRRSLPVTSDGYDVYDCSVFMGVRKDGTVSVVMLGPYPDRLALTPRPVLPPPPPPQQLHQHHASVVDDQRQAQTWPCASPPHSPTSPPPPQGRRRHQQQHQPRRPSISTSPAARRRPASPQTSSRTTAPMTGAVAVASPPPATATATATAATTTARNTSGVFGLLSSTFGFTRTPHVLQPPPLPERLPPPSAVSSTPRRRGGTFDVPPRPDIDRDRDATPLNPARQGVVVVPPPLPPSHSQGTALLWSPLAPTGLTTTSALVNSRTGSGGGPPLAPPAPSHNLSAFPADAIQSPREPQAATLKPTPPTTTTTTAATTTTVANLDISAFVEAAARAHGQSPPLPFAAATLPVVSVSPTTTTPTAGQSTLFSLSHRARSSSYRTPVTADVVPPTKPPPHLSVVALSLADAMNPLQPTSKTTSNSLLPGWCLHLADALLTPCSIRASYPSLQSPQDRPSRHPPPPQPQQPPSAPTPTSRAPPPPRPPPRAVMWTARCGAWRRATGCRLGGR